MNNSIERNCLDEMKWKVLDLAITGPEFRGKSEAYKQAAYNALYNAACDTIRLFVGGIITYETAIEYLAAIG